MKRIYLNVPQCHYEIETRDFYKAKSTKTNMFYLNSDKDLIYGYFDDDFPEEEIQKLLLEKLNEHISEIEKDLHKMMDYARNIMEKYI